MDELIVEPLGQLGKLDLHLVMMIQLDQRELRRMRNLLGRLRSTPCCHKLIVGS